MEAEQHVPIEEIIQRISNIHNKYIQEAVESVFYITQEIKNSIRFFDIKNIKNISLFERNLSYMRDRYYNSTSSGTRKREENSGNPRSVFLEEPIMIGTIVLTCYGLNLFIEEEEEEESSTKPEEQCCIEEAEEIAPTPVIISTKKIDDNVINFIGLYINIDKAIQHGIKDRLSEADICIRLKEDFEKINCKKFTTTSFFSSLTGFVNKHLYGDNSRWQYKYLKYKKKYINMKKKL